jgi:hypothetical protein
MTGVPLAELREQATELSKDAFCTAYPEDVLWLDLTELRGPNAPPPVALADSRLDQTAMADEAQARSPQALRYADRVCFLRKRSGIPFPDMISVGRASNHDITFRVSSISKLHATFVREGEVWTLADMRSTNGSFLNNERLTPRIVHPVGDGDVIQFGLDLTCTFLTPSSLYERLVQ